MSDKEEEKTLTATARSTRMQKAFERLHNRGYRPPVRDRRYRKGGPDKSTHSRKQNFLPKVRMYKNKIEIEIRRKVK